ncbi:hypothetical protein [Chryseolinea lacunae]|uniref:Beta-galactosidase n=1 Tax=Chryseolinea lacunae TaxID=2801331 RepID=A0ABS1KW76_9BACT|nr:hypothetical protein [Chryseolinea lacunae]MBL0743711.1 hypothetical protein [Chryseolinea lacunae]
MKGKDAARQTVIMIQVENEIGMLPSARDHHPETTKAFHQNVTQPQIQHQFGGCGV